MKKKEKIDDNSILEDKEQSFKESSDYDYIREKIKKRPVNKKRVIKKMLITAGSAVLFSSIACITFIFLEPVLGRLINKDSGNDAELNKVILKETGQEETDIEVEVSVDETPYEETPIENLSLDDDYQDDLSVSTNSVSENSTIYVTEKVSIELDDYQYLHRKMNSLSEQVKKSLVDVISISKDTDILNDPYYSSNSSKGVIVGESANAIFILARASKIADAQQYVVEFYNGDSCSCDIKAIDTETDLAILEIKKIFIPKDVKDRYTVATIGNSSTRTLLGNVVIAVGDPIGVGESVSYGTVTSNILTYECVDALYPIITTDIYGSSNSQGVLVNARGQVVGFITDVCKEPGLDNMVCAYGISGIKPLMEMLSNGNLPAYTGLHITNVSTKTRESLGIPASVYITKVDSDSPASKSGLLPGDVITSVNNELVTNADEYMKKLYMLRPDDSMSVEFRRLNNGSYEKMQVTFVVDERK